MSRVTVLTPSEILSFRTLNTTNCEDMSHILDYFKSKNSDALSVLNGINIKDLREKAAKLAISEMSRSGYISFSEYKNSSSSWRLIRDKVRVIGTLAIGSGGLVAFYVMENGNIGAYSEKFWMNDDMIQEFDEIYREHAAKEIQKIIDESRSNLCHVNENKKTTISLREDSISHVKTPKQEVITNDENKYSAFAVNDKTSDDFIENLAVELGAKNPVLAKKFRAINFKEIKEYVAKQTLQQIIVEYDVKACEFKSSCNFWSLLKKDVKTIGSLSYESAEIVFYFSKDGKLGAFSEKPKAFEKLMKGFEEKYKTEMVNAAISIVAPNHKVTTSQSLQNSNLLQGGQK